MTESFSLLSRIIIQRTPACRLLAHMTGGTHWGTPQPVLIACFAIPYAVTYLSFDPSTRLLRQALLLLGIGATGWMIMTFRYTKGMPRLLVHYRVSIADACP